MTVTVPEILHGAIRLVEQGWRQGAYYSEGCFCADGAMQVSAGVAKVNSYGHFDTESATTGVEARTAYMRAYRVACIAANETKYGQQSIIGFNDDDDTEVEDVIAVLNRALEIAGN